MVDPLGNPVETNVSFRIQVRSPSPSDCLLYEETRSLNMTGSGGLFAISLNSGTFTRTDTVAITFERAFANRGPMITSGACTYTPAAGDSRVLKVYFDDGSGGGEEPLPTMNIRHVPLAIESEMVGGFKAANLLRVEDAGVPGSIASMTSANYTTLTQLIAGTSTLYTKAGQLNGSALPTINAGESLKWNGSAWQTFTPFTTESDPNVSAFAKAALPACGAGQFLRDNGSGALTCANGSGLPSGGTANQVLGINNAGNATEYKTITAGTGISVTHGPGSIQISASGGGSVSSVDVTAPSIFNVTGGPVTGSGTIALALANQNQYTVFAGPNGTATGSPSFRLLKISDLRNAAGTGPFLNQTGACGSGQALGHNSVTDTLECQTVVTSGAVTTALGYTPADSAALSNYVSATLANGKILVGNGSNAATAVTVSGDATLSNTGALTLSNVVTAETGTKITYDAKGRVTASASLAAGDIPSLDWSKITSGTPTTLAGYGITDAVSNTLASGKILVGNGSNVATAVTMSGDATLSNTDALTLGTVAVGKGGTGTTTGSITGTGALTFTACGTNTNINLVPNGTGTVDMASKRITSLGTPTASTDAATKAYVDAAAGGGYQVIPQGAAYRTVQINGTPPNCATGDVQIYHSGSPVGSKVCNSCTGSSNWYDVYERWCLKVAIAGYDCNSPYLPAPSIGQSCIDGSIYAGLSPDGNKRMFMSSVQYSTTWNDGSTNTATGATSTLTGYANSVTIAAAGTNKAAKYCRSLNVNGLTDWYLPSQQEMLVLLQNRTALGLNHVQWYWTSTESSASNAVLYRSNDDGYGNFWYDTTTSSKSTSYPFRCIRRDP
jgi:hypothetical protein